MDDDIASIVSTIESIQRREAAARVERERARAESRQRNREQFPMTTKAVDTLRAKFGEDVRLIWAVENGLEIGRVP